MYRIKLTPYFCAITLSLSLLSVPAQAETPAQPEAQAQLTQMTHLLDALKQAEKTIPRDSFAPSAIVPKTELTPEALNTWVKDNTWLVPYQGALRDAQGVLMDRVGNSLDRALLLQALLRELGYDTRLAQASLTEEQAKQLLAQQRPLPATTLPTSTEVPEQSTKLISEFKLDADQLKKSQVEAVKAQQQLKTTLQQRVDKQTAELLKLLGTPASAAPDKDYQALQDHWWVQYQEKDQWLDLDPTLSTELAKQIHPNPTKTLANTKLSELPPELLHSVTIKVVLECAKGEQLTETVLVKTPAILPSAVLGKPLSVNHIAPNLPSNLDVTDLSVFKTTVLKQAHWFPVITVADQQYFEQEYTPQCVLSPAKPPEIGTRVDTKMNEVLGAFDSLEPPKPETKPANSDFITALWLEYEIQTPNQPTQTIRRPLFDLIGAAQRATGKAKAIPDAEQQLAWRLALLGNTDVVAFGHALSDDYLVELASQYLLGNRDALLQVMGSLVSGTPTKDPATFKPLALQLYSFINMRSSAQNAPYAINQINLVSFQRQLKLTHNTLNSLQGFDIVQNAGLSGENPFATQVKQGVIDTNAEALLLPECGANNPDACTAINTATLWELAKTQGIDWKLIRSPSDLSQIALDADAKQQMTTALTQGQVLIAPTKPITVDQKPAVGWWVINARSGQTLGIGEQGWGVSTAEYLAITRSVLSTTFCGIMAARKNDDIGLSVCLVTGVISTLGWSVGVGAEGAKVASQIIAGVADALKIGVAYHNATKK